jgi:hypothetical protein
MVYWKRVHAGDYKLYGKELLYYFIKNNKNFYHANRFWHGIKQSYKQDLLDNVPSLASGLSAFGTIKEVAVLIIEEANSSTLHIDHTVGPNNGVLARLNFPILNVEGTETCFFELPPSIYNTYKINNTGTKSWSNRLRDSLRPVSKVEITEPTIIRTSVPHTVICNTFNNPRITATVSFYEDLSRFLVPI